MQIVKETQSKPAVAGERSPIPLSQQRRDEFDRYWATRDLCSADLRTRLRIGSVARFVGARSGSLLDVGCGRGAVAAHFAQCGWHVTATDISPTALAHTQTLHNRIRTECIDLETQQIAGAFDAVVCLEVLQQVRHPVDVLSGLAGAMAPNGTLIVSLPNEFHLWRRLSILAGRVDFGGIEDTHIKLYTVAEHHRLFAACDLQVVAADTHPIAPPSCLGGRLFDWSRPVAACWPGLFALSVVYKLERTSPAPSRSGVQPAQGVHL